MYLTLLFLFIFVGCIAALYMEGMWGNGIRLINVITAGLLATNFFEPTADWLEGFNEWFSTCTYLWDFLAFWGLFGLFMMLFRLATDRLSKVKVRFLKLAERIGSAVFAAWIGWIMVCLAATSLHLAPLARNFLFRSFVPEERARSTLSPEMIWLGFVQKQSRGALSRTAGEQDLQQVRNQAWREQWQKDKTWTFDPVAELLPKYATRRANLEAYNNEHQAIRVRPEHMARGAQAGAPRAGNQQAAQRAAQVGAGIGFVLALLCPLISLAIWIAVTYWVYQDANNRGMDNAVLWAVIVFLGSLIGLIVYLIVRRRE